MNNAQFYYLLRRGVFGSNLGNSVAVFRTRVLNDGGIFESRTCVNKAVAALEIDE